MKALKKKYIRPVFATLCCIIGVYLLTKVSFPDKSEETDTGSAVAGKPAEADHIAKHSARIDSLLLRKRAPLVLLDAEGKPVKNRVTRVRRFESSFPDLNDVQLATAKVIGVNSIRDREEAAKSKNDLVYIADNPYYHVRSLQHSIPYLVPRAATLLNTIARAFIDSLATKGLPLHKIEVTSVLRTEKDIERLSKINGNASGHSCHSYGTPFDINYNKFVRLQRPE